MNKVRNSTFTNSRVDLDNVAYDSCKFSDCLVVYSGRSPISLSGCDFKNCTWKLEGPAQNTIMFLRLMNTSFGDFGQEMVQKIIESLNTSPCSTHVDNPRGK